jgi:hypothetical protein
MHGQDLVIPSLSKAMYDSYVPSIPDVVTLQLTECLLLVVPESSAGIRPCGGILLTDQ